MLGSAEGMVFLACLNLQNIALKERVVRQQQHADKGIVSWVE